MREIKVIQFVGISPIINGEARTLLAPAAKGIEKIEITTSAVNIYVDNGELIVAPLSGVVVTYKLEEKVPINPAFDKPAPTLAAASKKKT